MKEICELNFKDAVFVISTNKQRLKQNDYLEKGKIPVIDQGKKLIGGYTNDESKVIDCTLPVIVFGDHTKNVKLIKFSFAIGADGTKVLQPKNHISPVYLSYIMEVLAFKTIDKGYARHYQHIEKETFKLVSEPQQKAIVRKIEELFSSLDSGIADLKKAQDQLKMYRQAVLKKAFEGELTVSKLQLQNDTLKNVVTFTQGIQVPKPKQKEKPGKDDVRFLRIIDFTQGKDKPRYTNNPGDKYFVTKDDISMVRYGATTGFVCSGIEGVIANNMFRIIPKLNIAKSYLYYFFKSPTFFQTINTRIKGAAMPAISFGLLNDIIIKYPKELKQQHQIVREIESRLSVCDKVEKDLAESLEKAEALRQSILKKAFEGKLLTEEEIAQCKADPDYEPASVLLERIKIG